MIKLNLEIDSNTLRQLVIQYLNTILNYDLELEDIRIEVKSKQNYKSDWEAAEFRARVNK